MEDLAQAVAARECVIEEKLPKITHSLANQQACRRGDNNNQCLVYLVCYKSYFFFLMIHFLNITFVCRRKHNADLWKAYARCDCPLTSVRLKITKISYFILFYYITLHYIAH